MTMSAKWFYILGTVLFASIGQLIIKWRVDNHGAMPAGLKGKVGYFSALLMDPLILFAFFLAFVSALFWMATVSKFELNMAYPLLIVCTLLLTVASSTVLLHESFTVAKFVGISLISIGAFVLIGAK